MLKQVKILIAGGFGAGKTTMVGAVSEITPLTTEEQLTDVGKYTDNLAGIPRKNTTTVAMDFGRRTFPPDLILYLYGTPGQERFWFMWGELCRGATGAIVIADTRRLDDSFGPIEFFERRGIPFIVAINEFDDAYRYTDPEIRVALALKPHVPLARCDARVPASASQVLVALLEDIISPHPMPPAVPAGPPSLRYGARHAL